MKFKKKKTGLENLKILSLDDDFSLVKRFIEEDESAFETLVLRHKDKVRNIIFITLGNANAIDDIAQEVFLTVYKNLKSFRFESQFTTWLYRITVNKCKDHLRKIKIRNVISFLKEDEEEPGYNLSYENINTAEIVQKGIAKLPEKLRVPLLLKDIEGMSYQEIAEIVKCELGTVKSRIFRARESLKNILEPFRQELMS